MRQPIRRQSRTQQNRSSTNKQQAATTMKLLKQVLEPDIHEKCNLHKL